MQHPLPQIHPCNSTHTNDADMSESRGPHDTVSGLADAAVSRAVRSAAASALQDLGLRALCVIPTLCTPSYDALGRWEGRCLQGLLSSAPLRCQCTHWRTQQ